MVKEWVYCPRLAYLMWVDGEWADTSETVEGRRVHRATDQGGGRLPAPDKPPDSGDGSFRIRAITLASERLGVIAKLDVIEGEGSAVTPVDFKRGRRPDVPEGAYLPERVQICLQL
ncbi:MAG: Dna2/Cas4 domain-containing protein [Nitratireductor sp.]